MITSRRQIDVPYAYTIFVNSIFAKKKCTKRFSDTRDGAARPTRTPRAPHCRDVTYYQDDNYRLPLQTKRLALESIHK